MTILLHTFAIRFILNIELMKTLGYIDFCKKHDLKVSRKDVDDLVDDIKDATDIDE